MKPLITRVLLATDFSHCAEQALSHALAIASSWKADLHILHVLEFLPGMNPEYPVNQMYLEQLRNEAAHDMNNIEKRVTQSGLPARTMIDVGVPSHRSRGGSNRGELDRPGDPWPHGIGACLGGKHGGAGGPHCIVPGVDGQGRGDAPSQATVPANGLRFQRLLIPVDFSASSLEALEYGVQLARHAGSAVTILHVLEPVAYGLDFILGSSVEWRTQKAYVEGRLEILRALCTSNGIKAEQMLKAGTPADSIRDYAERQQPDLVIMGTHGRRGISRMLSGSVAETMLRLAPCPVLTVRTPVFGSDHERIMPAGEAWFNTDTQGAV